MIDWNEKANVMIRESGVKWVQTLFTDLLGNIRSVSIPTERYLSGDIWERGTNFDGSSTGFRRTERSDLTAIPDPATFRIMDIRGQRTAFVLCNIHLPQTREVFEGGPRSVALRATENALGAGFVPWMQPEMEFYIFSSIREAVMENDVWSRDSRLGVGSSFVVPTCIPDYGKARYLAKPKQHYFSPPPVDRFADYREELATLIAGMGIPVKYHHHEHGTHQIEIELGMMQGPVPGGDAVMVHKYLSRLLGVHHDFIPSYMPKPLFADAGNGLHAHIYLENRAPGQGGAESDPGSGIEHSGKVGPVGPVSGDRGTGTNTGGGNAFYDPDDELHLSQTARYFIGGMLDHARGITAITNPTTNSYKRLVPEFEAPVFITWSPMNRTALVRVPAWSRPEKVDVEYRSPDPSCNPYLAFSMILQAGLDGIRRKMDPGDPMTSDPSRLTPNQRRQAGIRELPATLTRALEAMETDELVKRVLGAEVYELFLEQKWKEVNDERIFVSSWEIYKYFEA